MALQQPLNTSVLPSMDALETSLAAQSALLHSGGSPREAGGGSRGARSAASRAGARAAGVARGGQGEGRATEPTTMDEQAARREAVQKKRKKRERRLKQKAKKAAASGRTGREGLAGANLPPVQFNFPAHRSEPDSNKENDSMTSQKKVKEEEVDDFPDETTPIATRLTGVNEMVIKDKIFVQTGTADIQKAVLAKKKTAKPTIMDERAARREAVQKKKRKERRMKQKAKRAADYKARTGREGLAGANLPPIQFNFPAHGSKPESDKENDSMTSQKKVKKEEPDDFPDETTPIATRLTGVNEVVIKDKMFVQTGTADILAKKKTAKQRGIANKKRKEQRRSQEEGEESE